MAYANINGISIFYEIRGTGKVLVLIPGLGTAGWIFDHQVELFAESYQVLLIDNRGSGKSDCPPGLYTIEQMSADLLGLLDLLKINHAHFLGVSMGGFIAIECALRRPATINKLVLAATSAGGSAHLPMTPEDMEVLMSSGGGTRQSVRRKLALAFSDAFMQTAKVEEIIDHRLANPQSRSAFLAQANAGATFDRSADVEQITSPTLVLGATGDKLVPFENSRRLASKIPDSQLISYEGFGHQFLVENAAVFNRDVLNFLEA